MPAALVTGASTGIGLATALHLARNGYRVFAGVRDPESAIGLRDAEDVTVLRLDVCEEEAVRKAAEAAGPVDVLVNNAGIGGDGHPTETGSIAHGQRVFNTNYWGAIRMTQAVLPAMRIAGRGTIVNITSMMGRLSLGTGLHYVASKHALDAASELLAQETGRHGIRVAIIEPGVVATPIFSKRAAPQPEDSPYRFLGRRSSAFFRSQLANPTLPEEVAASVDEAITTATPKLRYIVGADARTLIGGRKAIADEDWMDDFALPGDEDFFDRMQDRFGRDLWREPAKGTE